MDLLDIFKAEDERKRDYYQNLYEKLQQDSDDYAKHISEINSMLSSYRSTMPNTSSGSIPSEDFEPKRVQFDDKLAKYISNASEKTASLTAAKEAAYNRYLYYKDKATAKEGK